MKIKNDFKKRTYPDWYWKYGICDATIEKKQYYSFLVNCDNNTYTNCLRIELDSSNAMFENDIVAIEFYNYKELGTNDSMEGFWWYSDSLEIQKGRYILHAQLRSNISCEIVKYDIR